MICKFRVLDSVSVAEILFERFLYPMKCAADYYECGAVDGCDCLTPSAARQMD